MKITLMRESDGTSTLRTLNIDLQLEAMKHETKAQPVANLRNCLRYATPDYKMEETEKLSKVIPAAAFRKTPNGQLMTEYNGLIQIEVNHLANQTEVNLIKQEASELSQTFAAFVGSSGHSVKIWIRFTRPDTSLPKSREEAEIFQAHAYRKAVSLYQPALSTQRWNSIADKRMIRNFITIRIPPLSICANRWKCLRKRLTKRPYRQKPPLSDD